MTAPSEQEEQWFKEQELKKKADEQIALAHQAAIDARNAARAAGLKCPSCGGALKEREYEKVRIDQCADCGGVWLDKGELETLTGHEKAGGFFSWLSI